MTRLDAADFFAKLSGQCTDAGGGGVGESLFKELQKVERVLDGSTYLAPTCSLHAHQLNLANPIKKLIGEGALGKQNAMQLMHSLFNLQIGGGGTFEVSEFKKMWTALFNEPYKKIIEPVLTR